MLVGAVLFLFCISLGIKPLCFSEIIVSGHPSAAPWQLRFPYTIYIPTVSLLHANTVLIQAVGP